MASDETILTTRLFRVVRHQYTSSKGKEVERFSVQHPGAVTIVPILDDGRICMVQNHRVAVGQTLLELPAGTREPNELPERTALRELEEETGYLCRHIELLCEFFMSPGILHERMFVYLATGLTEAPPHPEDDEELEPIILAWDDVMGRLDRGEIHDAKTIAGLLYYDRWKRNRSSI